MTTSIHHHPSPTAAVEGLRASSLVPLSVMITNGKSNLQAEDVESER